MLVSVVQSPPIVVRAKQGSQTSNNPASPVFVNDNDLWFPAVAGETWSVEWWVVFELTNTGVQFAVNAPSDVTILSTGDVYENGSLVFANGTFVTSPAPTVTVNTNSNTIVAARISAFVQMGLKNGPIGLQFTNNNGGTGNSITLLVGSCMWATRE